MQTFSTVSETWEPLDPPEFRVLKSLRQCLNFFCPGYGDFEYLGFYKQASPIELIALLVGLQ